MLRHTYATALGATGANFAVVKMLLNHSTRSSDVTMRYIHVDVEQTRPAQEAVTRHLLDRVKRSKLGSAGVVVPIRRSIMGKSLGSGS